MRSGRGPVWLVMAGALLAGAGVWSRPGAGRWPALRSAVGRRGHLVRAGGSRSGGPRALRLVAVLGSRVDRRRRRAPARRRRARRRVVQRVADGVSPRWLTRLAHGAAGLAVTVGLAGPPVPERSGRHRGDGGARGAGPATSTTTTPTTTTTTTTSAPPAAHRLRRRPIRPHRRSGRGGGRRPRRLVLEPRRRGGRRVESAGDRRRLLASARGAEPPSPRGPGQPRPPLPRPGARPPADRLTRSLSS